jgi:5-deoxy-glucuronate isomerase
MNRVLRHGETGDGTFTLVITPEQAGWGFSGLRVLELEPGATHVFESGDDELVVLPLSGGCRVGCDDDGFTLDGRSGPFAAVTDFCYVPRDSRVEIVSDGGGRFALPSARAERTLPARYVRAQDVAVGLRGAGAASRQINDFCGPESFEADRLIAVEVLTPGGNWSSYPPHKHDELVPGVETELEEIYYFEVAADGVGYQRVYSSGPGRDIDVCAEVRTGDAIVMPFGYHGPSMAAPGYDLYYLNVMAGPGERAWRFTDDPAHAWIRDSWADLQIDPRLPLTAAGEPD